MEGTKGKVANQHGVLARAPVDNEVNEHER